MIEQPILLPIGLSYLVQGLFESILKDYYLRAVEKVSVSLVENSSFSVLKNPIQEIGGLNFWMSCSSSPNISDKDRKGEVHESCGNGKVENCGVSEQTGSHTETNFLSPWEERSVEHIVKVATDIRVDVAICINLMLGHFTYSLLFPQKVQSHQVRIVVCRVASSLGKERCTKIYLWILCNSKVLASMSFWYLLKFFLTSSSHSLRMGETSALMDDVSISFTISIIQNIQIVLEQIITYSNFL